MDLFTPYMADTLSEYIDRGSNDTYTYYNFSAVETEEDMQILISNILEDDYMSILKQIADTYEMTDEQYNKFKYKPELLSIASYGTPELYFIILIVNDMLDKKEFDRRIIKMVNKDDLMTLLNTIYNAESDYLDENK